MFTFPNDFHGALFGCAGDGGRWKHGRHHFGEFYPRTQTSGDPCFQMVDGGKRTSFGYMTTLYGSNGTNPTQIIACHIDNHDMFRLIFFRDLQCPGQPVILRHTGSPRSSPFDGGGDNLVMIRSDKQFW